MDNDPGVFVYSFLWAIWPLAIGTTVCDPGLIKGTVWDVLFRTRESEPRKLGGNLLRTSWVFRGDFSRQIPPTDS